MRPRKLTPSVMSCPGTCTFIPQRPVTKFIGLYCQLPMPTSNPSAWMNRSNTQKKREEDEYHNSHQHRTQSSQFRQDIVNLVIRIRHLDRDLSEVVGMRTRQDLFVVIQVLRHGDQVVLDIGEIQALLLQRRTFFIHLSDLRCRISELPAIARYLVVSTVHLSVASVHQLTSLCQTLDHIRLVTHQSKQTHDLLPACPDSVYQLGTVFAPPNTAAMPRMGRTRTYRLNISLCSASFKIKTSSSILSTSYSILWMSGPNASVMSSIRA